MWLFYTNQGGDVAFLSLLLDVFYTNYGVSMAFPSFRLTGFPIKSLLPPLDDTQRVLG